MDPVAALEIYELVVKAYETYVTGSIVLAACGGFILGIGICLLAFIGSTLKSLKNKDK